MFILNYLIVMFVHFCLASASIRPLIVNGKFVNIGQFPHSAFLSINCVAKQSDHHYMCGSSILNQMILITAGHCLNECLENSHVTVYVGNEKKTKGYKSSASNFKVHEKFSEYDTRCDIALIKMKRQLSLGPKVARVSILKNPPESAEAQIAGWGNIDEVNKVGTNLLKSATQRVWKLNKCTKVLGSMPSGTLCAGTTNDNSYAAQGDSGSALIVHSYIQIGLVSYKIPNIARNIIVYTDVSYHYDWIQKYSKILYCG